jgi:uncharacterized membrane protein
MTGIVMLITFYLLVPLLIIWMCQRIPLLGRIGAVVIAYILGLVLGNLNILPAGAVPVQDLIITIAIPLALPLLLFSLKINRWIHLARKTGISMLLALIALISMLVLGHILWHNQLQDSGKVAGMLVGVYTGGTPNLASIKHALQVDETTYLLTHTYDLVLCAIYLFVLITFGKGMLRRFLPRFHFADKEFSEQQPAMTTEDYRGILLPSRRLPLLAALGVAIAIFAIGGGLSMLVPKDMEMITAILSITTLGIIASLIPALNRIEKTFELGMYFILIFSLVVASKANLSHFSIASVYLFYYVTLAVFGTLILHVLLSKIFRIDADTTIITSVAMIFSPPFVPMMAGVLKNREIIFSGLGVGILGYAIGNYLGVLLAYFLR